MMRWIAAMILTLVLNAPAHAQNLALDAPHWAQGLLASDLSPTTGGRAIIAESDAELAIRLTILPRDGGVARVIRYEARANQASLALRRFTGHPSTNWRIWGADTPYRTSVAGDARVELERLARAALNSTAPLPMDVCPNDEQAFLELARDRRAVARTILCVGADNDHARLARRLSELAGSRDQEELRNAGIREVMEADRAFAAMAQTEGVPAAFVHYAGANAVTFANGIPHQGRDAVERNFASWPAGATLTWAPEAGDVSERGDMAWTWGRAAFTPPGGAPTGMCYVSIWKRDFEGEWRFAFDASIAQGCNNPPAQ